MFLTPSSLFPSQGVRFIISTPCMFQSAVMPHHVGVSIQSGMTHLKPVLNDIQKADLHAGVTNVIMLPGPLSPKNDCHG